MRLDWPAAAALEPKAQDSRDAEEPDDQESEVAVEPLEGLPAAQQVRRNRTSQIFLLFPRLLGPRSKQMIEYPFSPGVKNTLCPGWVLI